MPETVRGHALHARRRGLYGWSAGIAGATVITAAFYPFVAQEPAIRQLMETLPDAVLAAMGAAGADFFSPAGYLDARLFGLIAPLLFLIFAIGWATRTLAGEEEDGRLELLLGNPLARSRVLLEKAVALGAGLVLLAAVSFVVLLVLRPVSDLTVPVVNLVAMHVSLVLLSAAFGALALALAAATGRRGLSTGVSAAVAVLAYLVDSFASLVDGLERVQPASPFYLSVARGGPGRGHRAAARRRRRGVRASRHREVAPWPRSTSTASRCCGTGPRCWQTSTSTSRTGSC